MARAGAFIERMLESHLNQLALTRKTDVMAIYGPMYNHLPELVRDETERIKEENPLNNTLTILLDTQGGLIGSVEKMVDIIRYHYEYVDFIIPRRAMSAGTIFAMSADNIYMDYYSQLGPIDPQFFVAGEWVPGLGYLEKFRELNEKSSKDQLTPLEYALANKLNLATLHRYEQAREHSIELLEKWLSNFKFKDWEETESEKKTVTLEMKQKRAKEIAQNLNDTKRWHAHSRRISMKLLQEELGLRIKDIRADEQLRGIVQRSHSLVTVFMESSEIYSYFSANHYNKQGDAHE